ncbi:hypothetical protein BDV96DRAFT_650286 [Lophiotrema nucula]|uniref:Calcium/calmodulin-dependent protein kinase II association-domain domain-containing protein n=1 Tax=Lophiotrema nucula TaxID=690887 RepID=A0A6A5YYK7_9PLEO|nr:hypothetical protein BDV96DRAFT_650286 [Lophiotrema nucula]
MSSTSTKTEVSTLLQAYASALSASSTSKVMDLYTTDAVFMPQNFTTIEGHAAIKETYEKIFDTIALDVTMDVKEVHSFDDEWAFARTTTAGIQKVLKTGETSKEGNQELFVCQKVDGSWKMARYCFCSTNPPK